MKENKLRTACYGTGELFWFADWHNFPNLNVEEKALLLPLIWMRIDWIFEIKALPLWLVLLKLFERVCAFL